MKGQLRKATEDVDRQEWTAFLALVPLLDLSQVDERLLERCARWLAAGPAKVTRGEIKLHSGLWFSEDGAFDLVLAPIIRDGSLEPLSEQPGWLLVKNAVGQRPFPDGIKGAMPTSRS